MHKCRVNWATVVVTRLFQGLWILSITGRSRVRVQVRVRVKGHDVSEAETWCLAMRNGYRHTSNSQLVSELLAYSYEHRSTPKPAANPPPPRPPSSSLHSNHQGRGGGEEDIEVWENSLQLHLQFLSSKSIMLNRAKNKTRFKDLEQIDGTK